MASDWKDALGGLIGKTPEEVARTQRQPAGQKASSGKEPPAFFSRDDYVDLADQCMQRLGRPSKNKWNKENEIKRNYGELTSSQMRNLFALVTRLYNRVTIGGEITPADIGSIKVRWCTMRDGRQDVRAFAGVGAFNGPRLYRHG